MLKQKLYLCDQQIIQWQTDGYLLLKKAIPLALIEAVRQQFALMVDNIISELQAEGLIQHDGSDLPFEERLHAVAGNYANRFGRSWRQQVISPPIYDLHRAQPLVSAISQITGTDVIGHPVFNARPKLPNQQITIVPWHQDSGYFGAESETALIPTAWIPLVPVDSTNGCLQLVAGSHRMGLLDHHTEAREGQFLEVMDRFIDKNRVVTCPMELGDALLFHNLTLHRSTAHTNSKSIRWAIDIRYLRDGDDGGSVYWKDPNFKWVIASQTQPITSFEDWLSKW